MAIATLLINSLETRQWKIKNLGNGDGDSMIFKWPQYFVKTAQARHLVDTFSRIWGISHIQSSSVDRISYAEVADHQEQGKACQLPACFVSFCPVVTHRLARSDNDHRDSEFRSMQNGVTKFEEYKESQFCW